jgi:hypothetical protein
LLDDPIELLDAAGRGVDVRRAQPCAQQVLVAEDVQRKLAVMAVVAMEETPFLLSVQRVVGGVRIQPDRLRRCANSRSCPVGSSLPTAAAGSGSNRRRSWSLRSA